MNGEQMELFPETQIATSAAIIRFPLARRHRTIAVVAATFYGRKTERAREAFWAKAMNDLTAELRQHGAGSEEVDRQLVAFRAAVQVEIYRIEAQQRRPGGAA